MIRKSINVTMFALLLAVGLTACSGGEKKTPGTAAETTTKAAANAASNTTATEGATADRNESSEASADQESANQAPDFTATLTTGKKFTLSEAKGKPVLLNFWATWCGPCVEEMPAFQKLYKEYGDKVQILAVDCMEDKAAVDAFITKTGYNFPIAYDLDGSIEMKYPTEGIPYTVVIDPDGNVAETFTGSRGADAQYETYKAAIEAVLD